MTTANLKISAWLDLNWPVEEIQAVARHAAEHDAYGVWLPDHFMGNTGTLEPSDVGQNECFSLLAALAATVPTVRLGSMVAGMTYRQPAVLAKAAATIDRISGGRLVLGLGAGWQENEHAAYGIPLGSMRERIDRYDEGVQVIRGLLTRARTTFTGAHYRLVDAPLEPKPIQQPLPILLGAAGVHRTLGLVARLADEWNCWSTPETYPAIAATLDEHCERIGRDPASIWRTTQAQLCFDRDPRTGSRPVEVGGSVEQIVDAVGRWRATGMNEWLIPLWGYGRTPGQARDLFERVMTEVMPKLDS